MLKKLFVLVSAVLLALVPIAGAQRGTLQVAGLADSVEIIRDRWGIAHIYAKNEPDLFLAQGYNAARDRLFQLEIWRRQATGTAADILGPRALKRDIGARLQIHSARPGADPLSGRDALLNHSLTETVASLTTRLGSDMTQWQYGQERYKHVLIRHMLSPAVKPELRSRLDVGPLPRGGYATTVNAAGAGDNQTAGASFRLIADTENWDNSVGTNTPGQSGDPDSPHYRDLFELWAKGRYFPVLFSRAKVESAAEEKLLLEPPRK